MRIALFLLLIPGLLCAADIKVSAPYYKGKQAQLIRFTDYFTFTPELLSAEVVGEDGIVKLSGDLKSTELVIIRIDHVNAYLYLESDADLKVAFPPLADGVARTIANTNTVELTFLDLEPDDPNALLSRTNDRVSDFYDQHILLSRVGEQRSAGELQNTAGEGLAKDSTYKAPSLKEKVDSLASALEKEFEACDDPFFKNELHYTIAGLYWSADVSRKWFYKRYFEGKDLLLNSPAWVDLFRSFYQKHFMLGPMYSYEVEFRKALEFEKDITLAKEVLKRSDFVENDDQATLLLINGIQEYYHTDLFNKKDLRKDLELIAEASGNKALSKLARSVSDDLTTLESGLPAPAFKLIDNDRNIVSLEDLKGEYVYLGFWASWCSSCMKELAVMKSRFEEYGKYVRFLTVNMDDDPYERAGSLQDLDLPWTDLYYMNDPLILDRYRIRSVPQFFLIGPEGEVLEAPADRPSAGIAADMHRIKTAAKRNERIKVWDD